MAMESETFWLKFAESTSHAVVTLMFCVFSR